MTENTGPMDATGRPMLRFEGMEQSKDTPADVEFPQFPGGMLSFPSMEKKPSEAPPEVFPDPFEQRRERVAKAEAEVAEQQAEQPELSEYVAGVEVEDYSKVDVSAEALDLSGVDGQTRQHIESIRGHDFEGVVESLMPELEGISDEDMEKYITKPLEAMKGASDVQPYVDYAIRHLLRIHDFKKQGGL